MGGGSDHSRSDYWRADSVDSDIEPAPYRVATIKRSSGRPLQRKKQNVSTQMSGGLDAQLDTTPLRSTVHPDENVPPEMGSRRRYGYEVGPSEGTRLFSQRQKKAFVICTVGILFCILAGGVVGFLVAHFGAQSARSGPLTSNVTSYPSSTTLHGTANDGGDEILETTNEIEMSLLEDPVLKDPYLIFEESQPRESPPIVQLTSRDDEEDIFSRIRNTSKVVYTSRNPILYDECQFRCKDGSGCVPHYFRCDNAVQCSDASDEVGCGCAERLEPWKHCDGFADCPSREDELGCNGCFDNQFSCSTYFGTGCYDYNQWCDGVNDCQDGQDELECIRLNATVPYLTAGFAVVERNMNGRWYPVCVDHNHDSIAAALNTFASKICRTYNAGIIKAHKVEAVPVYTMGGRLSMMLESGGSDRYGLKLRRGHCKRFVAVQCVTSKCKKEPRITQPHLLEEDKPGPQTAAIVGGSPAMIGNWPWIVAIYRNGTHICGGVILNEYWILTAGHCFNRYFNYYYEVQAGMVRRLSLSPFEQTRTISLIVQEPGYNPTNLRNDIAVARVSVPFSLNKYVNPICLADVNFTVPVETVCHVAGWGSVNETGYFEEIRQADLLQEVSIPIVAECRNSYNDKDKEVCAGQQGKDSCQGDSGSPLLCPSSYGSNTMVMTGLVSHGKGCARASSPGVYTKIAAFRRWIDEIVARNPETLRKENKGKTPGFPKCPGITCRMGGGSCVLQKYICDGYVDCIDGEDELNCTNSRKDVGVGKSMVTVPSFGKNRGNCSEGYRQCFESDQCVPEGSWCNMKVDCFDQSDESECTCGHYLLRNNSLKVCDGFVDCADFSDEMACEMECNFPKFYCPLSQVCLSNVTTCNRIPECPFGEDELFCLALVKPVEGAENDLEVHLDEFGYPLRQKEGFVAIKTNDVWHQLCSVEIPKKLLLDLTCEYIGLGLPMNSSRTHMLKDQLIVRQPNRGQIFSSANFMKKFRSYYNPQKVSFLQTERMIDEKLNGILLSGKEGNSLNSPNQNCGNLFLKCGEQLPGIRPFYRRTRKQPSTGRGVWPWHVLVFNEGKFICDGTLITTRLVYVSTACLLANRKEVNFITLIAGATRLNPFNSPFEQTRKVVKLKRGEDLTILEADLPFDLTFDVNPVLVLKNTSRLRRDSLKPRLQCFITNMGKDGQIHSYPIVASNLCTDCIAPKTDNMSSLCKELPKSGFIVCTEDLNEWHLEAGYKVGTPCSFTKFPIMPVAQNEFSKFAEPVRESDCPVHRCGDGKCLKLGEVCDGKSDCRDSSDEPIDCQSEKYCRAESPTCFCGICTNGRCLSYLSISDGEKDCPGGEDELLSVSKDCRENLPSAKICDGIVHCIDGSDELDCPCTENTFRCNNSMCIQENLVCDGAKDCSEGEDEDNCITISKTNPEVRRTNSTESGLVWTRLKGKWYPYCPSDWNKGNTDMICTFLKNELRNTSHSFDPVDSPHCQYGVLQISC